MSNEEEHVRQRPATPEPGAFEAWQRREQALSDAKTPKACDDLGKMMGLLGRWVRQVKRKLSEQNEVALFRVRCFQKAGELIKAMPKNPGSRRLPTDTATTPGKRHKRPKTFQELGITKKNAKQWQDLTALSNADLRAHCRAMTAQGKVMTMASCLALLPDQRLGKDAARMKTATIDAGLGRLRHVLDSLLERFPGEDARGDIVSTLRSWATEIERELEWMRRETERGDQYPDDAGVVVADG